MKVWSLGDAVDLIPLQTCNMKHVLVVRQSMLLQALLNSVNKVVLLGVGEDAFGHFMQKHCLIWVLILVQWNLMSFTVPVLFLSLQENGERDFTFLVAESADQF